MKLSVEDLSFSYRCWDVLKNISFQADAGNLVCLLGENGAGKSTLFRCILGLLPYTHGKITVDGGEIRNLSSSELARRIAYIPQTKSKSFSYTVLDMVLMGTTAQLGCFSCPGNKQRIHAGHALELLKIENLADRNYSHLSGGEQQLVLIARAIAQQADVLIMDEPCSSLDYGNQIRVMEQVKKLARQGYLVILSTHNPEHALQFGDQVLVLHAGKAAAFGPPCAVLSESLLKEVYGIPVRVCTEEMTNIPICFPEVEF